MMKHLALSICLLLCPLSPVSAQGRKATDGMSIEQLATRLLARLEIKARRSPPAWSVRQQAPRFTFAVVSDIHLSRTDRWIRLAMRELNRLGPAFVVITGDNVVRPTITQHRRLKRLLDQGLRCRYHILKGDNDARNYSQVFGPTHWSFLYGGVHFLGSGLDVDAEGHGIGFLDDSTFSWLRTRLRTHRDRPTLYFQHENVWPPTFLHAPRLGLMLLLQPQVAATITGHLHADLGFRVGRTYHLIVPALKNERHAFKFCRVYRDGVVVQTAEWADGRYTLVQKWQHLRFTGRHQLAQPPKGLTDYLALPPRPTRFDDNLTRRWQTIRQAVDRWSRRLRR